MKYDLVIFDMDGTILDTLEDLMHATNHALEVLGHPTHDLEEVRWFTGNGAVVLATKAMPAGTPKEGIEEFLVHFRNHYKDHGSDHTKPYEGIPELIRQLRADGLKTAVVSNKPDYGVQMLCREYFDGCFDYAVGVKDGVEPKPAPDSVNECLRALGIPADRAIYVGDSDVDVETAANSGMECIGVTWGFRGREFLEEHGAQYIVDRAEDIMLIAEGE